MTVAARYPGIRITANGNQLVSYHTETRIADAGVFYPITPSTEGGELFQQAYADRHNGGTLTVALSATVVIVALIVATITTLGSEAKGTDMSGESAAS